ncbi:hypothetical protein [Duncaniella freteri]|uniref:hypothetical protein n=1 Tax=Duncaniella freteri TaxID=2530391 RepID=UPI003F6661B2
MNTEEIKELATEVAAILYNEDKTYNSHLWWSVDPKERKAEELEDTIAVILRDHCIVPKAKAQELCRLTLEHGNSEDFGLIDGLVDIVCDMFEDEYHQEAEK